VGGGHGGAAAADEGRAARELAGALSGKN
jgi:hypothetical protein